ncbi:hypothetical protein cyc_06596 [Cyclospora cayetanensis]|uniref:Uncharacterized protein n=1 Tax=Cyclospora cayetanensis TaxID=88456 RepID=A0A1D3D1F3_9EIME|nr:hypothetical protein cyc_06596 [Cyclospora cayetanensis]
MRNVCVGSHPLSGGAARAGAYGKSGKLATKHIDEDAEKSFQLADGVVSDVGALSVEIGLQRRSGDPRKRIRASASKAALLLPKGNAQHFYQGEAQQAMPLLLPPALLLAVRLSCRLQSTPTENSNTSPQEEPCLREKQAGAGEMPEWMGRMPAKESSRLFAQEGVAKHPRLDDTHITLSALQAPARRGFLRHVYTPSAAFEEASQGACRPPSVEYACPPCSFLLSQVTRPAFYETASACKRLLPQTACCTADGLHLRHGNRQARLMENFLRLQRCTPHELRSCAHTIASSTTRPSQGGSPRKCHFTPAFPPRTQLSSRPSA